jgi:hypothetical protein
MRSFLPFALLIPTFLAGGATALSLQETSYLPSGEAPASGLARQRLPPLESSQRLLRASGAMPEGYSLVHVRDDGVLPPLGPRQIPQFYVVQSGNVLKADRVTISAEDFLRLCSRIPVEWEE